MLHKTYSSRPPSISGTSPLGMCKAYGKYCSRWSAKRSWSPAFVLFSPSSHHSNVVTRTPFGPGGNRIALPALSLDGRARVQSRCPKRRTQRQSIPAFKEVAETPLPNAEARQDPGPPYYLPQFPFEEHPAYHYEQPREYVCKVYVSLYSDSNRVETLFQLKVGYSTRA